MIDGYTDWNWKDTKPEKLPVIELSTHPLSDYFWVQDNKIRIESGVLRIEPMELMAYIPAPF